ncbi:MAG: RNA methyltransferase [Clostridia bacterium]|nr:RNA methyltransferase [Clostridia bacterium]
MQRITSKDNEFIKHIKKLKDKKYRDEAGEYIIEGIKLIEEAIQENAQIKQIVICEENEKTNVISKSLMYEISKYDCVYVTQKVFNTITQVTTPQGIFAVASKGDTLGTEEKVSLSPSLEDFPNQKMNIDYKEDIIVALDDIQDPGNLGTILRTVDSCGLKQLLVSKGTVDCYNPKVVRSTMGAIFRVKVIECEDLVKTIKEIKRHHFKLQVTALDGDKTIYDVNYKKKIIVVGNEANGVSKAIQDLADEKVKIPMLGKTESLNASVAAGVVLYEYTRQKLQQ